MGLIFMRVIFLPGNGNKHRCLLPGVGSKNNTINHDLMGLKYYMNIKLERKRKIAYETVDAVVIPVFKRVEAASIFGHYPELEFFFRAHKFKGAPGEELAVYSGTLNKLLAVVGAGEGNRLNDTMRLAKKSMGLLKKHKVKNAVIHFCQDVVPDKRFARVFVDFLYLNSYIFDSYKGGSKDEEKNKHTPVHVQLICDYRPLFKTAMLNERDLVNRVVSRVRDLVNEPPSAVNPDVLVETARRSAVEYGFEITVMRRDELASNELKGILAVGSGSPFEPALIHLTYTPPAPVKRVALVGKAITFDAGGLNLKPAGAMLEMKSDMAGGAAVLGIV